MKTIASNCNASCTEPGLTDARARLLSTMVERVVEGRDLDADDLDGSVAASTSESAVRRISACPIDRSPLCRDCGHSRARHQLDFNDGDTCEPWCDCTRFHYPSLRSVEARGWFSCSDNCTCGGAHMEGRVYFVSARARRWREGRVATLTRLLLGPFSFHRAALDMVDEARRLAEKRYARADESSYGTCSLPGDTKEIGMLDERYVAPVVETVQTGWEWAS